MTILNQDNITIGERVLAPTPKFFRIIRTFGLLLGTIGGTILAAPVALPVALTTAAGYLIAVGSVAAAVSQTTVDWKEYDYRKQTNIVPHQ